MHRVAVGAVVHGPAVLADASGNVVVRVLAGSAVLVEGSGLRCDRRTDAAP